MPGSRQGTREEQALANMRGLHFLSGIIADALGRLLRTPGKGEKLAAGM